MLLTSLPRGPALGSPTARSSPLEAGGHDQVRGDTKGVKIHANIKLARVVLYVVWNNQRFPSQAYGKMS